jgi:hypothetical protein
MNTLRGQFSIEVAGKQTDINLNLNAFRILTQDFGVSLDGIDKYMEADPLTGLCAIAYCGAKNAALRKMEKFGMDFDVFSALVLDEEDILTQISEGMQAAMGGEPGNA